ncbi:SirB2 family protein [Halomonas sp. AOP43-D1-4]|uniref:SirB2 family protein n=1 Tax=Halomonas sp. AOP43-D1-4 TaxID=3457658 RepID=UPI0040346281
MIEHYFAVKHLHMAAAYASLAFFIVCAYWSVTERPILKARWVKILPHIIDTALLTFGVLLAIMLSFWPLPPWLSAKITALIVYILLGTMAIKRGKTPAIRAGAAVAAVLVFIYILGVAMHRTPLSWLS